MDRKKHWEDIYRTKESKELSWYQPVPSISLDFIKELNVAKTAKIIDVGGGDSLLVDYLLDLGYEDITVLDISEVAIEKAKHRLGDRSKKVKWIIADIITFEPTEKYDFWNDRAAFHFLTQDHEIEKYLEIAQHTINPNGVLLIGTFSNDGPTRCSGIEIKQYSEQSMNDRINKFFKKLKCIKVEHKTPFDTIQKFVFCSFIKLGVN